jgi:hypothetical protein
VTLPERIADWNRGCRGTPSTIGLVSDLAAAYEAALTALEASDRDRQKLREELKCSHDTLCKIGGAVRFFFPDIPIAGDTVANIEAEAVKVKARIKVLEDLVGHCWVHSGYRDCGYDQMDSQMRELYDAVKQIPDEAPEESK